MLVEIRPNGMTNPSQNILLLDASNNRLNAGPKARLDTAFFLTKLGFTVVNVPNSRSRYWRRLIAQYLKYTSKFDFPADSVIWCQFPLESTTKILLNKARKLGLSTVVFIHDIEGLKSPKPDWVTIQAELDEIKQFTKVLSLNKKISSILHNNGIATAADLECWDYHCDGLPTSLATSEETIRFIYAGNLSSDKSGFLYKLGAIHSVRFDLFGQGLNHNHLLPNNLRYMGVFNPNTPPLWAGKYFGLVWDGCSIDTCTGEYGAYLAFNTPHKASLYLSRNLPVIVWCDACIAPLIEEHNAGVLVSSLNELETLMATITLERYDELKRGAAELGQKIREGYFITKAALAIQSCDLLTV